MTVQPTVAPRAPGAADPSAGQVRREQVQPLRPDDRVRWAQARQQTL